MKVKVCMMIVLATLLGLTQNTHAQKVSVLKSVTEFDGKLGAWGKKSGNKIVPAKGYVFYAVGDVAWVVLPQDRPTPGALEKFIKSNKRVQMDIMGEEYDEAKAERKKKKKKPKPGIRVVCKSKSNCNGTCGTIIDPDTKVMRCTGNCCGGDIWNPLDAGHAQYETASGR